MGEKFKNAMFITSLKPTININKGVDYYLWKREYCK